MKSNDQRFDRLVEQAVAREKHLEAMNARIVESVRRSARRRRVKMWCRMVAILASCAAYDFLGGWQGVAIAALIALTGIVTEIRLMADFSPHEV